MIFTFHYVSIKSIASKVWTTLPVRFTFHYVSIKSAIAFDDGDGNIDLHSTMYLLNLKIAKKLKLFPEFTFHYVSIKSQLRSLS